MKKRIAFLALFIFTLLLTAFAVDAADGMPVAYYTFEYGDLVDFSGNGYHGTAVGAKKLTFEREVGRGVVLELNNKNLKRDGGANGFKIPVDGLKNAEAFTLVMDVYVETDGGNQVWFDLSRGKSGSDTNHYIVGLLAIRDYGINAELGTKALSTAVKTRIYNYHTFDKAGQWAQLAYVNDGGTASIYLDGVLVASGDQTYSVKDMLTVDGVALTVGMPAFWADLSLDAKLDNVAVYDYALTPAQLAAPTVPDAPLGDVYFSALGANGLLTEYHLLNEADLSFGDCVATYIEDDIDREDMSIVIEEKAGATDYVAVRWTGRIVAPESGNYIFSAYSDNGIRLAVGGEQLLDWWVNKWDVEQISSPVYLEEGEAHEFTFEWFEYTGGAHVVLRWENDRNIIKRPIPKSAFYLPSEETIPVITKINASAVSAEGGTLAVRGEHLQSAECFELVRRSGASFAEPLYLTVTSLSDSEAVLELPAALAAGLYHIKPHYKNVLSRSDEGFTVPAAPGAQDRAERPDPSWQREDWVNLNGWWEFAFDADEVGLDEQRQNGAEAFPYRINVPYGWESALSGITDTEYRGVVWYRRSFTVADLADSERVYLHFGAVDAKCIVYVNGTEVARHNGGYTPFEVDVTAQVQAGENVLTLWVEDKASYGDNTYPALIGKQGHNAPCGYTHTSGIWQTVYMEYRNVTHLAHAKATPHVKARSGEDSVAYTLTVRADKAQTLTASFDFTSKLWDEAAGEDKETGSAFTAEHTFTVDAGESTVEIPAIAIENAKLWSDREPNLYYGSITLTDASGAVLDTVKTYFGLREVYTDIYADRAYEYIFINGKPVFLAGLLDQGFWQDGIYTARDEAALKFDILEMKNRGFNMIRKHIKIEDPLQYYWCDKLGMFVWQDMPHATAMNAVAKGGVAPGRALYESTLSDILARDCNKPSVIAVILFNETWGINHAGVAAADGMTTHEWMISLYHKVKAYNAGLLVEDMSPLKNDHIQPTDLNTYHMYPITYKAAKAAVEKYAKNAYEGSTQNFYEGFTQEKEPLLNSEYGGVGVSSGDRDVSLCFKYQTDLMRMTERFNGYVYTEPYDIEYERNGILTYDRRAKLFPYNEIAWGGDMTIVDLNQPCHVGIYDEPAKILEIGSVYTADAVASNWSGETFTNAVLHWRLDATDAFGNAFTTGVAGERAITYAPYTAEHYTISFTVPDQTCIGTLTVWVTENGEKLAKNFINVIIQGAAPKAVESLGGNAVALRTEGGEFAGKGALTLVYDLPEGYDVSGISSLRLLAEVSSVKEATVTNGIPNSATSQTVEGGERPSDMTVSVGGIEIGTVYIPDGPRDVRGTQTFNYSSERNSSADNFGYLVDLAVPADKLEAVRSAIMAEGEIRVTYAVKADAEHQNGLRLYGETKGRYALKPTAILNAPELHGDSVPDSANYRVSATLSDGDTLSLRGGAMTVALSGGMLNLGGESVTLGAGAHTVSVHVFDTHYSVYADGGVVPVIDLYSDAAYTSTAVTSTGEDLSVLPETYTASLTVGDVNRDGDVTVEDVLLILRAVINRETNDHADLNGDGTVSLLDVLKTLRLCIR